VSGRAHHLDLLVVEATLATPIDPRPLRLLYPFPLALPHEPPLHLGDHPEDGKEHVAGRRPRADVRVEDRHVRPLLLHLVNDVEYVPGVSSEPVKARDDELVSRPEELDDGRELAAALAARAGHLFRPYHVASLRSVELTRAYPMRATCATSGY
jgi:hypothetical protein